MSKALLIAVAAAFALTACGPDSSKKGPASSAPSSSSPAPSSSAAPSGTPPAATAPSGAPAAGATATPSAPDAKKDEKK